MCFDLESKMTTWQTLEEHVRKISEIVWCVNAKPETIAGVKCDCVLKIKPNYWVLIEISKESTLSKLRTDLAKFQIMQGALFSKRIFPECHFITPEHFPSLYDSGRENDVSVYTPQEFYSKFLGANQYIFERRTRPFGSAVDPDSGETDKSSYVPISYYSKDGAKWSVEDIASNIEKNKKIVLLGEFGSGKSRCLMEVFSILIARHDAFTPIAINLRDNWGYKKFSHIVHNHLDSLGLGEFKDALVRSLHKGMHPILLDGFDEIGSQSWSGDMVRLSAIRKSSLQGIRDLIDECNNCGVLITGREHYFNTDSEMLECLGLTETNTIILSCPNEFSTEELQSYISGRVKIDSFPSWLPRKPLLCQLLTRIEEKDLQSLVKSEIGETDFFEKVLDAICERETKIHSTIYKDSLKTILLELATLSRLKDSNLGPISPSEISSIFEKVTGAAPIDESAIVLQRLPYLGRSSSDTADRTFIDDYAVDGLRALALVNYYYAKNDEILNQKWRHPLSYFGYKICSLKIHFDKESLKYFRTLELRGNPIACSDFIGSSLLKERDLNFSRFSVTNGKFSIIDLTGKTVSDLTIAEAEIGELIIEDTISKNFVIKDSIIDKVIGISSSDGFPDFIIDTEAGEFEDVLTISRISELDIDDKHKTLLSIIKKLFFQPGKGRKEEALLRGTERYWDERTARKILNYMYNEGIVDNFKGDDGLVYRPMRSETVRMKTIMNKLGNSDDALWLKV